MKVLKCNKSLKFGGQNVIFKSVENIWGAILQLPDSLLNIGQSRCDMWPYIILYQFHFHFLFSFPSFFSLKFKSPNHNPSSHLFLSANSAFSLYSKKHLEATCVLCPLSLSSFSLFFLFFPPPRPELSLTISRPLVVTRASHPFFLP